MFLAAIVFLLSISEEPAAFSDDKFYQHTTL